MSFYPFLKLEELIKEQINYLENTNQSFQNEAEYLISQFFRIKNNESKIIMLLSKYKTVNWLESATANILSKNDWTLQYLSSTVETLERQSQSEPNLQYNNPLRTSLYKSIENIFHQISHMAVLLEVSFFNPALESSLKTEHDLTSLFSKYVELLTLVEKEINLMQNDLKILTENMFSTVNYKSGDIVSLKADYY